MLAQTTKENVCIRPGINTSVARITFIKRRAKAFLVWVLVVVATLCRVLIMKFLTVAGIIGIAMFEGQFVPWKAKGGKKGKRNRKRSLIFH